MSEIITVGLDLAKNVFQAHGADASGRAVLRRKLRRDQVLDFFGRLAPCVPRATTPSRWRAASRRNVSTLRFVQAIAGRAAASG